jgi:lipoate-protein ligase A
MWRILLDGRLSGARNMAVDAAILRAVEAGESPPTLRLYGWTPWCVSLGHFQKPERELDAVALRARGWDFVMRPTGGRAVLHADEITYSLLARRDEAPWCATLGESYDRIGAAWAVALDGYELDMVKGQPVDRPDRPDRAEADRPAPPCFVSSARAELAFGGRKVVGSAQRRTRDAFVQHGSIPVTPDHERLVEVLPLDAAGREDYLRVLREHAVSLGEITALPGAVDSAAWTAWNRRIAHTLLNGLGATGVEGALSAKESAFADLREAEHREKQREFYEGAGGS